MSPVPRRRQHGLHAPPGALCLALALIPASIVHAQEAPRLVLSSEFQTVTPYRPKQLLISLREPPELDGVLDDPCWERARPVELTSDMPGGTVSRKVLVRACRDDTSLYVSFECREPALGDFPVRESRHDVWTRENVQVYLAPPHTHGDCFLFAVDPQGSKYDWSLRTGPKWTGPWQAEVSRTTESWYAEIGIPLKTLGVEDSPAGQLWRVNLGRDVAATGEQCSWEPTLGNRRDKTRWAFMFFGSRDALRKLRIPPRITIAPKRWVVETGEIALKIVLAVQPGSAQLAKAQIRLTLTAKEPAEGDAPPPLESIVPLIGHRVQLLLNAGAFPSGLLTLKAELLARDGTVLTTRTIQLRKRAVRHAPAADTGQLDILVPKLPVKAPAARRWPITTGVALPRGALYFPENVRLLGPDGKEIPCQTISRAKWSRDGSIRWLGLDFQADVTHSGGGPYRLQFGPGVQRAPVTGFVRNLKNLPFEVVRDTWLINTGAILFTVNYRHFTGIEEAWIDADGNAQYDWTEQILLNSARRNPGPYVVSAGGRTYHFAADPKARLELEEWNELRLVLRGEARLLPSGAPARAEALGRCILRIIAFAGRPFLKLQFTFVFNNRAAQTPLKDIGIFEHLDFRNRFYAAFGMPGGFKQSIRKTGTIFLLKLGPRHHLLQNIKDDPEAEINRPEKYARNWVCAAAQDRGMVVCLRDMDYLHPKELELRPGANLYVHFWPPHGDPKLKDTAPAVNRRSVGGLGFAHAGQTLDLHVPRIYTDALKDRRDLHDFHAVRDMHLADPTGIALTYDLLYLFYAGDLNPDRVNDVADAFELRPHAVQDRKSLAASGLLAEMLPPERAQRAAALALRLIQHEMHAPQTGDFNYLDLHRQWLARDHRWALDHHWMGNAADLPAALWLLYLQTGSPDLFRLAARNIRHIISVDICHDAVPRQIAHADPRRRNIPGAFSDHATPVHWQSTCHVNDRHARISGPLLAYYLTGNLAARDAARLWAHAAKTYGRPNYGEDGLAFMDNLLGILELDDCPILLQHLGDCADRFFQVPLNSLELTCWSPGLRHYARRTGDPRAADFIASLAADPAWLSNVEKDFRLLGLLRDLHAATGRDAYLQQAMTALERFEARLDRFLAAPAAQGDITWADLSAYVLNAGDTP